MRWLLAVGFIPGVAGCGPSFQDTLTFAPRHLDPPRILEWQQQVRSASSLQRVWYSDRVEDEQLRFEPPYFYVQVLPVSLTDYFAEVFGDGTEARGKMKDLFIAPYTTTPLPHQTRNFADARSVIFLLAQNRSEDYVSEGTPNWTATTVEAAAVSLTFCAVDKEQPRLRRWLTANTTAPQRISSENSLQGSKTYINGVLQPSPLPLPNLLANAVNQLVSSTGNDEPEIDLKALPPLRSPVRGSRDLTQGMQKPHLLVSPGGDQIILVADTDSGSSRQACHWTLPSDPAVTATREDVPLKGPLLTKPSFRDWTTSGRLRLSILNRNGIQEIFVPSAVTARSFNLTGVPFAGHQMWEIDSKLHWLVSANVIESPSASLLETGARRRFELRLWSLNRLARESSRLLDSNHEFGYRPSFSPDGTYVVARLDSAQPDRRRWLCYTAADGRLRAEIRSEELLLEEPVFAPNGKWVGVACKNKEGGTCCCFFSLEDGRAGAVLGAWPDWPRCIALSHSGQEMAVAFGPEIEIWSVSQRQQMTEFRSYFREVCAITYSPDGSRLFAATRNPQSRESETEISMWDSKTGEQLW